VLEFTVSIVGENAWEKMDRLRRQESLGNAYLEQKDVEELFSHKKLRYFIQSMCQRLSMETPVEVHLSTFKSDLDGQLKYYFNGEVTIEDSVPIFRAMVQDDGILQNQALKHIKSKCGRLAEYVAGRCRGALPEGPTASSMEIPSCRVPINSHLHSIAVRCGETVVLDDENHVTELKTELRTSHFLAMDAHHAPIWSGKEAPVDLVTIRCKAWIFALAPLLYPDVVKSVGRVFQENVASKRVFVWRGAGLLRFCQEQLPWTPENVVDIVDTCRKNEWDCRLSGITDKVVGGDYCRHASHFIAVSCHPSPTVLGHRAMTVSLFQEFEIRFCKSSPEQQRQESCDVRPQVAEARPRSMMPRPGWTGPSGRAEEGSGRHRDRSQEHLKSCR
jgi:hypothetical protein